MYELYVKEESKVSFADTWIKLDLFEGEKPAMTFRSNDIAELKDRFSSYSQILKLPKTSTNVRAFDFCTDVSSTAKSQYKKRECRLYSNETLISGEGSEMLTLSVQESHIEVQIIGATMNIFYLLGVMGFKKTENTVEAEYGLGIYQRSKARPREPESPFVRFGRMNNTTTLNTLEESMQANVSVPYLKFYDFAKYVIGLLGLELICKADDIKSLVTTVSDIEAIKGYEYENFAFSNARLVQDGKSVINLVKWKTDKPYDHVFVSDNKNTVYFIAQFSGSIIVKCTSTSGNAKLHVENTSTGEKWTGAAGPWGMADDVEVRVSKGDKLKTEVKEWTGGVMQGSELTFTCVSSDDNKVPEKGGVTIQHNIGFDSFSDYLKAIMQATGLFLEIDYAESKMYLFRMEEVYENTDKAKDWSSKVDMSSVNVSFKMNNFAQVNKISFEDDKVNNFNDYIALTINNDNLAQTKELFKLKFEATDTNNMYIWGNGKGESRKVAYAPIFETDGKEVKFIGSGKPRLCRELVVTTSEIYKRLLPADSDYLSKEYFSALFEKTLSNIKFVEAKINLTDRDVSESSARIPVFIKELSGYYYINKISNYVSGQLTQCELLKL